MKHNTNATAILRRLFLLAALVYATASRADNCDYSRSKLDEYLAGCRATDNCAYEEQMRALVAAECTQERPTQAATLPRAMPTPRPSRPPNPTLQPSAAAIQAQQQQQERENDEFNGEPCNYFTRPSIESEDGVTRLNGHSEGARVCYNNRMYVCKRHRWEALDVCTSYSNWRDLRAEKLEKKSY